MRIIDFYLFYKHIFPSLLDNVYNSCANVYMRYSIGLNTKIDISETKKTPHE